MRVRQQHRVELSGMSFLNGGQVRQAMFAAHPHSAVNQNARRANFNDSAAGADFVAAA
jgi:hypothetical protein